MLVSVAILLTVVGMLLLAGSIGADMLTMPAWASAPMALLAAIVLSWVALSAGSLQVAVDGGLVTRSEPALQLFAFMLAVIGFILSIALTIEWLPTEDVGRSSPF